MGQLIILLTRVRMSGRVVKRNHRLGYKKTATAGEKKNWEWWKRRKGNETNWNRGRKRWKYFSFVPCLVYYILVLCIFWGVLRALCSITGNTTAHPSTAKQYPAYISSRHHLTDIKKLPGWRGVGVWSRRAGVGENVHSWLLPWWNLL